MRAQTNNFQTLGGFFARTHPPSDGRGLILVAGFQLLSGFFSGSLQKLNFLINCHPWVPRCIGSADTQEQTAVGGAKLTRRWTFEIENSSVFHQVGTEILRKRLFHAAPCCTLVGRASETLCM